jgi:hypothetical protein
MSNTPDKNEEKNYQESFWRKQYELLSNWQIAESDRFWTRFEISLALNGGLLVAFAAIIDLGPDKTSRIFTNLVGPLVISLVGIALSVIWHKLTDAGRKWQDYWVSKGIEIEKRHSDEIEIKIFSDIGPFEPKAPVRRYRRMIPLIFICTWLILAVLILLPLVIPTIDYSQLLTHSTNSTAN